MSKYDDAKKKFEDSAELAMTGTKLKEINLYSGLADLTEAIKIDLLQLKAQIEAIEKKLK